MREKAERESRENPKEKSIDVYIHAACIERKGKEWQCVCVRMYIGMNSQDVWAGDCHLGQNTVDANFLKILISLWGKGCVAIEPRIWNAKIWPEQVLCASSFQKDRRTRSHAGPMPNDSTDPPCRQKSRSNREQT